MLARLSRCLLAALCVAARPRVMTEMELGTQAGPAKIPRFEGETIAAATDHDSIGLFGAAGIKVRARAQERGPVHKITYIMV